MSATARAEVVANVMSELGYDRYVVSGGDVGSSVAEALAAAHPDRVGALHSTDVPYAHLFTVDPAELTPEERDYLAAGQRWQLAEGAYALEQSTKPHTLAAALGDSPAGLAAWIVEKLPSWSDLRRGCGVGVSARRPAHLGDRVMGDRHDRHVVLGLRRARRVDRAGRRADGGDLVPGRPRAGAAGFRRAILRYPGVGRAAPTAGTFVAWERPTAYVDGLRAAVALDA